MSWTKGFGHYFVENSTIFYSGTPWWYVAHGGGGSLPEGPNPGCTVASWCLAFALHLVGIVAEGRNLYDDSEAGCGILFG